ncbi:MAG TPA: multicopper oxidase family protein [Vicinamibacteria bacterium]|nr:multicopper oxidase family protein [Vicinamibacteria bacterium]
MTTPSDRFPGEAAGLPEAGAPQSIELANGAAFDLRIAPVAKKLGDATVRMLAYGGSIPGPTLRVREGSEVVVTAVNEADLETTVHWHGLRLDNRYDGTALTQRPIPVGGRFTYRLAFPDPGVYWYHPHIREDYGQEMGLYGNIVVVPAQEDYWPPVDREVTLTLDDILLEDGKVAAFSRSLPNYVAMGRFGNVLLANGEPALSLEARRGEVVRFYLTDTANTRVFNLGFRGARMKLVGGDSGRCEREQLVERVLIAPSERAVVDVLFDEPGRVEIHHHTPRRQYRVATVTVTDEPTRSSLAPGFASLRTSPDLAAERERLVPHLAAPPDSTLALVAEMDLGEPAPPTGGTLVYGCPMHPEVVSDEPGRCPKCGMKLVGAPAPAAASAYVCPMHPAIKSDRPDRCPECGMKLVPAQLAPPAPASGHGHEPSHGHADAHGHEPRGIEWEDDMVEVNRTTTPANMRWKLIDRATGAVGSAIGWRFRVGDRVKIRLVNEMDSDHPMHHPFHIHGAGRFLVLSRDGVVESNLVWKDTVLVPTGQTVDLLLDVTNPGAWMAHCHIAEHHEGGMMFSFTVDP